jgi:TolB-like protein/Flp pilus assembly protein TadD
MPESQSLSARRAVFLSYASEDVEAAKRICEALRTAGIKVWFDQSELVGGDAWDQKIRRQIKECALFLPVISANTQARLEGYFRIEWKLAAQRTHAIAEERAFLLPVAIDGTRDGDALVPAEFKSVQWSRLPGGEVPAIFVGQVKRLLEGRSPLAGDSGAFAEVARTSRVPIARKRAPTWVAAAAILLVSVGAALWFARSPNSNLPSPGAASAVLTPTLPPPTTDKSIAVLPFVNASDDKENSAFFSDGVQEDLLTNLANIAELRVVSRTSVEQYRDTKKPIPQIARELGVTYILEGSVRRAGDKVRITGQLIRAATDQHLWAKSYDRDLSATDIFAIQAALSTEIASALQAAISPETKKLIERRPTENLAAYDLYVKSRREPGTYAGVNRRVTLLQEAVQLDPGFAEAWADLAYGHGYLYFFNADKSAGRLASAQTAIERAVALSPDSPKVIERLGTYYYHSDRDYARAIEQYEKLIRLQPNNADVYEALATVQRRQGLWLDAVANYRKAAQLDIASIGAQDNLSQTLQAGRRYAESAEEFRRAIERRMRAGLIPDSSQGMSVFYELARESFFATGSTKEVAAFLAGLTPAQTNSPRGIYLRKTWAQTTGDYAEAVQLDRLQPYFDEDGNSAFLEAISAADVLAALGDEAGARHRLGNYPSDIRARLEREPANPGLWNQLGRMERILGNRDEALRCVRRATELVPKSLDTWGAGTYSYSLALIHAWTGDKETALAELTSLLRQARGTPSIHTMRTSASTFPLHGDPRFEALLNDPKNNAPLF